MRCRLCLMECMEDNALNLLQDGEESHLTKLIIKYIHIEITKKSTSTSVCKRCFKNLDDFHNFILFIESRQNDFKELKNEFFEAKCILSNGKDVLNSNTMTLEEGAGNNEDSLLELENVMIEENDEQIFKEEHGSYDDLNDVNIDNNFIETDEDNMPLKILIEKSENSKKDKAAMREKFLKNTSNIVKKKRGRPRKNILLEADKIMKEKRIATSKINREREEHLLKSIRLKCEVCNEPANSFSDLRFHFREIHNSKAYVVCCGRRFRRRFMLIDHLRYHLNPDYYKCEICNKVLKSKGCLDNHHSIMHSESIERKHECEICGKRFPHLSNLKIHLITHENAKNHICEFCKKGFKSISNLRNHVKYVHENKKLFICEICGQKYKFKPAFQRHVAEHDTDPNQLTEECPICKKWFRPNGLRFHIGYHDVEDVKCEICGKVLKSKMSLKSHNRYWHKQTNVLNCIYCEKTFKRASVLQEHIAMHIGRKDYNCSYCSQEFRSKANMYAHIKKKHVDQWTQIQRVRNRASIVTQEKKE